MAVSEGFIQGPIDSSGKKVDTTTVIQTDLGIAHREGAVIVDGEILAARTKVLQREPRPSEYGPVVRPNDPELYHMLGAIHETLLI